ncbi:four-carbon acid sugar kinase family protein [Paracoccaceae bacterium GXU_MW_L88]
MDRIKVVIVSDDLTGLLDSAVGFARREIEVIAVTSPAHLKEIGSNNSSVLAVSTNSRELLEDQAIDLISDVSKTAPSFLNAVVFKKIDSRMKGHIAAEVAVLRKTKQPVILCPAIPKLGRIVKDEFLLGQGVDEPIAVSGVIPDALVPDAQTDADIDQIIAKAPTNTLFVGAAGLAEGLARKIAGGEKSALFDAIPAPILLAIGSRDPVTLKQLEGLAVESAPNGAVDLGIDNNIIRMTAGTEAIDGTMANARFAKGIAQRIEAQNIETLVASGGETAAAIMAELGAHSLQVIGEVLPGLPVSRVLGLKRPLMLITKSGGFGAEDTLKKVLALAGQDALKKGIHG